MPARDTAKEGARSKLTDNQLEHIWGRDRPEEMPPELSDKDQRALNEASTFFDFLKHQTLIGEPVRAIAAEDGTTIDHSQGIWSVEEIKKATHMWSESFTAVKAIRYLNVHLQCCIKYGIVQQIAMPQLAKSDVEHGVDVVIDSSVGTHIESLLRARDRLAEQTLSLPDPEEELLRIASRSGWSHYDRRSGIWPGCLEREQLPPGNVYNEPLYKMLFEHTRGDPHWASLGEWYDMDIRFGEVKDNGRSLPWWVEYEYWYMNRLHNLFEESDQACQRLCYEASIKAGNQSGPMVFFDFVVRPIQEVIRIHLGRPPLEPGQNEISFGPQKEPGYTIKLGGVVIASGVDQRGTIDTLLADVILNVRREFVEWCLNAPEILEIVETWRHLKRRAEMFSCRVSSN